MKKPKKQDNCLHTDLTNQKKIDGQETCKHDGVIDAGDSDHHYYYCTSCGKRG